MNRYAKMVGIASAVLIAGTLGAYAVLQTDVAMPLPEDITQGMSDVEEGLDEADLEFGQVEEEPSP